MDKEDEMVEGEVKKVIISETSAVDKTEETVRRNSTGRTSTRRTPLSLISISEGKSLPGYLRSSGNSCHEFCKYGKKHVFEPKERKPMSTRISSCGDIIGKVQKAETPALRMKTRKLARKLNTVSQPRRGLLENAKENKVNVLEEIHLPDAYAVGEEKESFGTPESMKLKTYLPYQASISLPSIYGEESSDELVTIERESTAPAHQIGELSNASETTPVEKRVISQEPAMPLTRLEDSSDGSERLELESSLSVAAAPKNQVKRSHEEPFGVGIMPSSAITESSGEPARSKATNLSAQKSKAKISQPDRSTASKARSSANEEKSSDKALGMKLITAVAEEQTPSKNLMVVKLKKREDMKSNTSHQSKAVSKRDKVIRENMIGNRSPLLTEKRIATSSVTEISERKSPPSAKKVSMHVDKEIISLSSMKKRSSKAFSPSKVQAKVGKLEPISATPKKKTLNVIEPKPLKIHQMPVKKQLMKNRAKSSSLVNSSSSLRSPESMPSQEKEGKEENESILITKATEVVLDKEKAKKGKSVEPPRTKEKRKPNRSPTTQSEAQVPSPRKLSFQRGKVVSPKTETSTPLRLKFRQPRGRGEDQNSKERRVILRRRSSLGSIKEFPRLQAPIIVLRHQDVQEKKGMQGLFNRVIEETASKLAETKKSKVKALVGAFETVISLQDSRAPPSAENQPR